MTRPLTKKILWESVDKYAEENEISDLLRRYSLKGILIDFIFFVSSQRKDKFNK